MLFVCLLLGAAFASGPPVDIANPDDCLLTGYLAGVDFPDSGGDCCSFVVCNAANLNKTGFIGKCMGGTGWNNDIVSCDEVKYLTNCDPQTDCDVTSRTTAVCPAPQPTSDTCCLGQDIQMSFPGMEPVITVTGESTYRVGDDVKENKCPLGMLFDITICSCVAPEEELVAPCSDDLDTFYFTNPADPCCGYIQCYPNRTAFIVVDCMPPSVWNDVAKACDIRQQVMACMTEECAGPEMTDPPCEDPLPAGDCCRAGQYYQLVEGNQYLIVDGAEASERILCCPDDMNGNPMIFNNEIDICCCEVDVI